MKKLILPIVIFAFVLTGCSSKVGFEPKSAGFSCLADVDYNGTKFSAKLHVGENGVFSAEVTEPSYLKGMSVKYEGENVEISYLGIETEVSPDTIPYFNYVSSLREVLLSVKDKLEIEKNGDKYSYSGETAKGKYDIEFRADGFPVKISIPTHNLTVTLKNFEYVY